MTEIEAFERKRRSCAPAAAVADEAGELDAHTGARP